MSVETRASRRWRCGHSSATMTEPSTASLMRPLTKLAIACLENSRLSPASGEILENFGLSEFGRPHQAVLDHIAGDRGQHQNAERQRDRRQHFAFDACRQRNEAPAVDGDLIRVGEKAAERRGQAAAHRAGKRRQHQRAAADHEPGRDLLALDDIAALVRLVEPLLCWVF